MYEATRELHNDKSLFQKQGDPDKWLRFNVNNKWSITDTASKDANDSVSWCHSMEWNIEHPTQVKSWKIYANGSEDKWEVHARMKCVAWSEYWSSPVLISGVVGKNANALNGVYEPMRELQNGKPVFQKQGDPHPTKVKSWNIYANGCSGKWQVNVAMKCTAAITRVHLTWHKYCIVYASIDTLFVLLILWLEFVAPRTCSMNLNMESCKALLMCSCTAATDIDDCANKQGLRGRKRHVTKT